MSLAFSPPQFHLFDILRTFAFWFTDSVFGIVNAAIQNFIIIIIFSLATTGLALEICSYPFKKNILSCFLKNYMRK